MADINGFKLRFPEFAGAGLNDSMIAAFLSDATAEVDTTACGVLSDQIIYLKTAQALALSPSGNTSKLVNADGSTTYDKRLTMLILEAVGAGPRAC